MAHQIINYIEDITRWREDMFEGQEQYLTSERSERVRYCSCYENNSRDKLDISEIIDIFTCEDIVSFLVVDTRSVETTNCYQLITTRKPLTLI